MLQDIVINLAAGLIFFILEVILVAWLLPRILDRRLDARWKPTRIAFAEDVAESHWRTVRSLFECWMSPLWSSKLEADNLSKELNVEKLKGDIQFYTMAFDPETTSMGVEYLQSTEKVLGLIEGILFYVRRDRLTWDDRERAAKKIAALRSVLVEQDSMVRRLRAHAGLREPMSDENLRVSIAALERLEQELASRPLTRPDWDTRPAWPSETRPG